MYFYVLIGNIFIIFYVEGEWVERNLSRIGGDRGLFIVFGDRYCLIGVII